MSTEGYFCFSVGGQVLAVEGAEADVLVRYEAFVKFATEGIPRWRVCFGRSVEVPSGQATLLSSFVYEEIKSRCLFHLDGDDYFFSMLPNDGGVPLVVMRHRRGTMFVESTSVKDHNALRFSLWFAVCMLVTPSMLTFIHSSTVVHRGKAVLFLGESGTGKSTHSRLWLRNIEDVHLLNDDSPMIEVRDIDKTDSIRDSVWVHGSSWSGKTPCYEPRSFPIAAIVRLSQAPHNTIRRLSTPQAFAAIQPSLPPAMVQDEYYADKIMDILSAVISNVPVYHLECLPDADAARICRQTVFSSNG